MVAGYADQTRSAPRRHRLQARRRYLLWVSGRQGRPVAIDILVRRCALNAMSGLTNTGTGAVPGLHAAVRPAGSLSRLGTSISASAPWIHQDSMDLLERSTGGRPLCCPRPSCIVSLRPRLLHHAYLLLSLTPSSIPISTFHHTLSSRASLLPPLSPLLADLTDISRRRSFTA